MLELEQSGTVDDVSVGVYTFYLSIDPHIDDVVVGVHDCIPHLGYAAFVPFTHWSF